MLYTQGPQAQYCTKIFSQVQKYFFQYKSISVEKSREKYLIPPQKYMFHFIT